MPINFVLAVSYLGCYTDPTNYFLTHSSGPADGHLTPWVCHRHCLFQGMQFSAMKGVRGLHLAGKKSTLQDAYAATETR